LGFNDRDTGGAQVCVSGMGSPAGSSRGPRSKPTFTKPPAASWPPRHGCIWPGGWSRHPPCALWARGAGASTRESCIESEELLPHLGRQARKATPPLYRAL